jgi:hypothetical protein
MQCLHWIYFIKTETYVGTRHEREWSGINPIAFHGNYLVMYASDPPHLLIKHCLVKHGTFIGSQVIKDGALVFLSVIKKIISLQAAIVSSQSLLSSSQGACTSIRRYSNKSTLELFLPMALSFRRSSDNEVHILRPSARHAAASSLIEFRLRVSACSLVLPLTHSDS